MCRSSSLSTPALTLLVNSRARCDGYAEYLQLARAGKQRVSRASYWITRVREIHGILIFQRDSRALCLFSQRMKDKLFEKVMEGGGGATRAHVSLSLYHPPPRRFIQKF